MRCKQLHRRNPTKIEHWQRDHFDWATQYVYGIEKDYRLVKVGKVGCYLHGDGLANVILSDGLARFSHNEYTGLLHKSSDDGSRDNPQFDIVLSNPPYSVSAFRQTTRNYYNEEDFELYNSLTDNSSEIECLFVERTKQLLKEGGVAGVILPSSLLTNSGIETKAREIILKYFDIVGLVELGSNTFMATGTNTVVLFLRRRDNYLANNIRNAVDKYILNLQEVTIGCVEKPISNYVHEVWGVSLDDYNTLLRKKPNDTILASNLFKAYRQEVTTKKEDEFWNTVIGIEAEKIACHILTSRQKVVVVKSGEKKDEKQFLGYEFSNRRGNEGIHAVGHSKRIEECTMLFDPDSYTNPDKASTYIYKAFKGEFPTPTGKLKDHVSTVQLSQIINFSRGRFAKEILTTAGNKPPLDSKYPMMCLGGTDGVCEIRIGGTPSRKNPEYFTGSHPWVSIAEMRGQVITDTKEKITDEGIRTSNVKLIPRGTTLLSFKLSIGRTAVAGVDLYTNEAIAALIPKDKTVVSDDYLFALFNGHFIDLENTGNKAFGKSLNSTHLNNEVKIPVPPMDIQRQIVAECRQIDEEYNRSRMAIETCRRKTAEVFERIEVSHKTSELQNLLLPVAGPTTKIPQTQILSHGKTPVVTQLNGATISGYTDNDAPITDLPLIVFGDHSCTFKYLDFPFVRGADGTQLLKVDEHVILTKYLYHYLRTLQIPNTGKYERHYKYLKQQFIPIPSIEEQRKMVDEIDRYDSTIADARQAMASCADRKHALLLKFLH